MQVNFVPEQENASIKPLSPFEAYWNVCSYGAMTVPYILPLCHKWGAVSPARTEKLPAQFYLYHCSHTLFQLCSSNFYIFLKQIWTESSSPRASWDTEKCVSCWGKFCTTNSVGHVGCILMFSVKERWKDAMLWTPRCKSISMAQITSTCLPLVHIFAVVLNACEVVVRGLWNLEPEGAKNYDNSRKWRQFYWQAFSF